MVQLIPLYVWSRSITGNISLGALFFFQMVRDAQDPKRRWLSIGTERSGALSHVVQPICFKFDNLFVDYKFLFDLSYKFISESFAFNPG